MKDDEYIPTLQGCLRMMKSPQCHMAASLIGDLQSRLDSLEKDAKFLEWCADRFVHMHGESDNVDFVLKLRGIASSMQSG